MADQLRMRIPVLFLYLETVLHLYMGMNMAYAAASGVKYESGGKVK